MQNTSSYIVLISPGLSGAEKRFFDIFCGLLQKGKRIKLIVPSMLAEILRAEYPERDVFDQVIEIGMERWSRTMFVHQFRGLLKHLEKGSLFHYPMNTLPFLHLLRGDQVTMSICDCEVAPSPWKFSKRSFYTYLVALFSRKIDVLSPSILQQAAAQPLLKKKLQLTPGGTYIGGFNGELSEKEPVIAFVGRLEESKGIIDLLRVLPELWARIKDQVPPGFRVSIAGSGSLDLEVGRVVTELQQGGVPVSCHGYVRVIDFIKPVSIVLSLQQCTNYPSRVVAEALLSGASVIVRDSGDSRMFGDTLPGLHYCGFVLEAGEMAGVILSALSRYRADADYAGQVSRASQQAFCSQRYIDYFDALIS